MKRILILTCYLLAGSAAIYGLTEWYLNTGNPLAAFAALLVLLGLIYGFFIINDKL